MAEFSEFAVLQAGTEGVASGNIPEDLRTGTEGVASGNTPEDLRTGTEGVGSANTQGGLRAVSGGVGSPNTHGGLRAGSGGVGSPNTHGGLRAGSGGVGSPNTHGGLRVGAGSGGGSNTQEGLRAGAGSGGGSNTQEGLRAGAGSGGGSNTQGGLEEPLSKPGAILPQPGDLIATNYSWKFGDVHEALSVHRDPEIPGAWCFEARNVRTPVRQWPLGRTIWLHGYRRSAGGRLLGCRYRPGMAGWLAQDHGSPWNGQGYDEIMVVRRSVQFPLFPFGAGPVGRRSA